MRVLVRTFGWPLSTRDTVWWETPASLATSVIAGSRAGLTTSVLTRVLSGQFRLHPNCSGAAHQN